jgi:hypothetical protein
MHTYGAIMQIYSMISQIRQKLKAIADVNRTKFYSKVHVYSVPNKSVYLVTVMISVTYLTNILAYLVSSVANILNK